MAKQRWQTPRRRRNYRYRYTPKRKAALKKAQLISARKRSRNKKKIIAVGVLAVGAGAAIIYGRKDKKHGGPPRDVIKTAPPQAKPDNIARRVMVSGSRIHSNPQEVFDVLENEYRIRGPMTVVHGDAVRGSDRYARLWAESALAKGYKIIHDPHPAEWKRYGNSAGHKRNQKMVDLGPEVVYAFPRGKASGTRGAMKFARIAGIKVVEL